MKPRYSLISIALLLIGGSIVAAQFNAKVPYVPSPIEVVDRMLEFAAVNQRDVVYDIGSGDGRVVIQAAKKYGSRGVGLELDLRMVESPGRKPGSKASSTWLSFATQMRFRPTSPTLRSSPCICCLRSIHSCAPCWRGS